MPSDITFPLSVPSMKKKRKSGTHPQGYVAKNRAGTRMIAGHFQPELATAMRELAKRKDVSLQEAMREAFTDILRKNGLDPKGPS